MTLLNIFRISKNSYGIYICSFFFWPYFTVRSYLGPRRVWLLVGALATGAGGRTKAKWGPAHRRETGCFWVHSWGHIHCVCCLPSLNHSIAQGFTVTNLDLTGPQKHCVWWIIATKLLLLKGNMIRRSPTVCHLADILSYLFLVLFLSSCDSKIMLPS